MRNLHFIKDGTQSVARLFSGEDAAVLFSHPIRYKGWKMLQINFRRSRLMVGVYEEPSQENYILIPVTQSCQAAWVTLTRVWILTWPLPSIWPWSAPQPLNTFPFWAVGWGPALCCCAVYMRSRWMGCALYCAWHVKSAQKTFPSFIGSFPSHTQELVTPEYIRRKSHFSLEEGIM